MKSPCCGNKERESVKDRYGRLAAQDSKDDSAKTRETARLYENEDMEGIPEDVTGANCACGNPLALASLGEGEVVLDLGSGAGLDVFLAAKRVGPTGRAYGVDATPEMIWRARDAAKRIGAKNAEFRLGEIEHLPLETGSVDVVISNCVINLSPEKAQVFSEAFRVLKPGGRLMVSDRVLLRPLPPGVADDGELWSGCVAGAIMEKEYLLGLRSAGFVRVQVESRRTYSVEEAEDFAKDIAADKESKGNAVDLALLAEAYLCLANDLIVARSPCRRRVV